MNERIEMDSDDLERIQQSMIFASGMLLGFAERQGDDSARRLSRGLAWDAVGIALALGHTSFLNWRYD